MLQLFKLIKEIEKYTKENSVVVERMIKIISEQDKEIEILKEKLSKNRKYMNSDSIKQKILNVIQEYKEKERNNICETLLSTEILEITAIKIRNSSNCGFKLYDDKIFCDSKEIENPYETCQCKLEAKELLNEISTYISNQERQSFIMKKQNNTNEIF